MFVFVYNNFDVNFVQQMSMFSFGLKSYQNYFDSKNAEMLFIYKSKNHVIDLKLDKKSLYDFLYALLEKKTLSFTKLFIAKFCVKLHSRIFQLR